jgi:putative cardiolipin synthase
LFLLLGFLLSGCATIPEDYPRLASTAIKDYPSTTLGRFFVNPVVRHPDESGFAILRRGRHAFTTRIALTELAEKSLDVQYYIWEADATGRILADRLLRAADRGVRVRVLVDDINFAGRDAVLASMDAHPNIEIRLFNPFANRNKHFLDFLVDLKRVNHRMHNKLMVADNAAAIVGGRNIGDHYFGVATDANFRDLDIAAVGPVVRDTSQVFDHFWNGSWAVPIAALVKRPYSGEDMQAAVTTMRERMAEDDYPYPLDQDVDTLITELTDIRAGLIWASGLIVWDEPADISRGIREGVMIRRFYEKLATLKSELLIESAYFVTRDKAVETARQLHDRGVRVRVLTNSLASNDVVAAHAGHAKRRAELISAGVELYELRPDAGTVKQRVFSGESKAALHTKTIVLDRQSVFIGSFNLDPRSGSINTEAGLYVESPELARHVIAYMDEGVLPQNSYRVLMDDDGELVWITKVDGREVRYHNEPETTFWQRFLSDFIMLLPVEHQL